MLGSEISVILALKKSRQNRENRFGPSKILIVRFVGPWHEINNM